MVPLPRFATWEDFNAWLEAQCRKRQAEILRGHTETIGERLARDLEAMADLPAAPFDACDQATGRVSSQLTGARARGSQPRNMLKQLPRFVVQPP